MNKYNQYTQKEHDEVLNLYENGFRVSKISKKLNIPRSTIREWLSIKTPIYEKRNTKTDLEIINAANESRSMAQMLKKLDMKPAGWNYYRMKIKLHELGLTCDHWVGQVWSKDEQLKDWSQYKRNGNIKKHLITLREHKCERCNLSEWQGVEIPIELHHIDGNRCNNELENLQLLCNNCHALTPNYRVPKKSDRKDKNLNLCIDCNTEIKRRAKRCRECEARNRLNTSNTKIVWPTDEELGKLVWEIPSTVLARRLGISDQSITNRCKKRNIKKPESGYWSKFRKSTNNS